MTTYERAIKRGRRLIAMRRMLPLAVIASTVVALLVEFPFRLIHDNLWLVIAAIALACAGIWLRMAAERDRSGEIGGEGIFSVMRFPLITSNLLLIASIVVYAGSAIYMVFAATVCLPSVYCVILAQEHKLQSLYGEAFTSWCRTTYAITPLVLNYRPSVSCRISAVNALADQSTIILLWTGCMCLIDLLKNVRVDFELTIDFPWLIALGVSATLRFVVWIFRKR